MTRRDPGNRRSWHHPFGALIAVMTFGAAVALAGCTTSAGAVPGCGDPLRLAIVAQSVPSASYLPCIRDLRPGWTTAGFDPTQDGTSFLLDSDRSPGRPVTVRLTTACRISGASPSPARAPGVLSYTRLDSIRPRFAGRLYDVFPGGPRRRPRGRRGPGYRHRGGAQPGQCRDADRAGTAVSSGKSPIAACGVTGF